MPGHTVYNLAKAGHAQLIRALALELAPAIPRQQRSPGANVWPEGESVFDPAARAYPQPNPAAKWVNPKTWQRWWRFAVASGGVSLGRFWRWMAGGVLCSSAARQRDSGRSAALNL